MKDTSKEDCETEHLRSVKPKGLGNRSGRGRPQESGHNTGSFRDPSFDPVIIPNGVKKRQRDPSER